VGAQNLKFHAAVGAVRGGVAAAAAFAAALAASQSNAQTAGTASPTVTRAEATGIVSVVPGSPTPKDCLRFAKEICTCEIRATETGNTYEGPGQLTERVTIDFTKPQSSAAGICFPQFGIGTVHTAQGDFNLYNQGQNCRPPQSASVAPGFRNIMLNTVITGGTGRFQHALGAFTVSANAVPPPAPSLYHAIGAFVGIGPAR
jgi:hypothetical protein